LDIPRLRSIRASYGELLNPGCSIVTGSCHESDLDAAGDARSGGSALRKEKSRWDFQIYPTRLARTVFHVLAVHVPRRPSYLSAQKLLFCHVRVSHIKREPLSPPFLCFFPSSRPCSPSLIRPLPLACPYSTSIPIIRTDWTGFRGRVTTKPMHAPLLSLLQAAYAPLPSLRLIRPL
jgi:hypothetical protein